VGVSFAGTSSAFWPQPNNSPFSVPLSRVSTGFNLAAGCTYAAGGVDPTSALLGLQTVANGGSYGCNFGGPGVQSYVGTPLSVDGVAGGTSLNVSGGFVFGPRHTSTYNKNFLAPSTTYYGLQAAGLPSGVYQWETIRQLTSTTLQQVTYYYSSPLNLTTSLPPLLNQPAVNITSIFNNYYIFQIQLATQPQYMGSWIADYTQANTFGGTNEVVLLAMPHYFGSNVPANIDWSTPGDNLLDPAYMPKPPGLVNGNIFGYGFSLFGSPQPPNVWVAAARLNVAF
jgi:hypothetical protein